jgi:hypothetical protein
MDEVMALRPSALMRKDVIASPVTLDLPQDTRDPIELGVPDVKEPRARARNGSFAVGGQGQKGDRL